MTIFESAVIFLCITASLSYINERFIKLPTTIGVMAISLVLSLIVLGLNGLGFEQLLQYETSLVKSLDFSEVLMDVMLSLLLFAGAIHIDLSDLRRYRWPVGTLALFGTVASTVVVAGLTYVLLPLVGIDLPLLWCFIFGALISPTDPIAVMGILKSAGAPKSVETVIAGESLFNDGLGVVVFVLLVSMLGDGGMPTFSEGLLLFVKEAVGGVVFGFLLGSFGYYLIQSIDNYKEEVLITLAIVLGGYLLAKHLHISGLLAMVVTGLMIGNHGRNRAMSDVTREYVDQFWELIDEILNAVLFVLIGLEIVLISYDGNMLMAAILAIIIALLSRTIVVGATAKSLRERLRLPRGAWKVLVWGGLRGGISVALVLSLPAGEERDILLALTYAIVVFSILVQGLTVGRVAKGLAKS